MRSNPNCYINPGTISITPNANHLANDIAVYIQKDAKIKAFHPNIEGMAMEDTNFQEWTLTGRNRRLATDSPYTIYARLSKTDRTDGYLVFAAQVLVEGEWRDPYILSPLTAEETEPQTIEYPKGQFVTWDPLPTAQKRDNKDRYWWIKIGTVSAAVGGERTIELDTGILGTELYNNEWQVNPGLLPMRVGISSSPAGNPPYIEWGGTLVLESSLVQGWDEDAKNRLSYWGIERLTGTDQEHMDADAAWNASAQSRIYDDEEESKPFYECGKILLIHSHTNTAVSPAVTDDFNAAVSATFIISAWGRNPEYDGENGQPEFIVMAKGSITVLAETMAVYGLQVPLHAVRYNPVSETFAPDASSDIPIKVRATAEDGQVSLLSKADLDIAALHVFYKPVGASGDGAELPFTGSAGQDATANLNIGTAFQSKQSLNLSLVKVVEVNGQTLKTELDSATIALVSDGKNTVILELDNEYDAVQTDSTGKITAASTVSTTVRLYDGSTEVDISNATFNSSNVKNGPGSSVATFSASAEPDSGKGKRLSWAYIAGQTMSDSYEVEISYTYNGTVYKSVFTMAASKGQAVWKLQPAMSSIPFQRDSNNQLVPASQNVGIKLLKIDGDSSTAYDSLPSGMNVRYSFTGMPDYNEGTAWSSGAIAVSNSRTNLYIALYNQGGVLLDSETVPCVKDGEKGADGFTPTIGQNGNWFINGVDTGTKAEGKDGTGVALKGTRDVLFNADKTSSSQTSLEEMYPSPNLNVGDCYTVKANRHLYFFNGTSPAVAGENPFGWQDMGEFKGEPGDNAYLHMAWADDITFDSQGQPVAAVGFTTVNGSGGHSHDYDYVGYCTDHNEADPQTFQSYKWNYQRGKDGDGYEYVYMRSNRELAPAVNATSADSQHRLPTDDEYLPAVGNYDGSIFAGAEFTDDPQGISDTWPYEWQASRKKQDGAWGAFTPATLHRVMGDSPWVADLDNEMDGIITNQAGLVRTAQQLRTNASLYYGNTARTVVIDSVQRNNDTPITVSGGGADFVNVSWTGAGLITITYAGGANFGTPMRDKDVFTILLHDASDTTGTGNTPPASQRTLIFTVMPSVGVVYNLQPSVSQVNVGRTDSGGYSPSAYNLTCGYKRRNEDGSISATDDYTGALDGKWRIYFRLRTRSNSTWGNDYYRYSANKSMVTSLDVATYDAVEFLLCDNTGNTITTPTSVIDRETVPVMADGQRGTQGIPGLPGLPGENGENGLTVCFSPSVLIFSQSTTKQNGVYPIDAPKTTEVVVTRDGSAVQGVTCEILTETHCTATVTGKIVTVSPDGSNPSGSVTVRVTVGTDSFNLTLPIYTNLLGTWKQSVENGTCTEVASRLNFRTEGGQVMTLEQTGTYIRGYEGQISTIEQKTNGDFYIGRTGPFNAFQLRAIRLFIEKPGTYYLSIGTVRNDYRNEGLFFTMQQTTDVSGSSSSSGSSGDIYTINLGHVNHGASVANQPVQVEQTGWFIIWFQDIRLTPGQVDGTIDRISLVGELGTTMFSQIRQTASEIDLEVNSGLRSTGINIQDGLIDLHGGKVSIDDSLEVPTVVSMNDDMYTEIRAGRIEIHSRTTASAGIFAINTQGEIVLQMYDRNGALLLNVGGTPDTLISGEWKDVPMRWIGSLLPSNPDRSDLTANAQNCTNYKKLILGTLQNSGSAIEYFLPPNGSIPGDQTTDQDVISRNNCLFTSVAYTENNIKNLAYITDGWYIPKNNGIFKALSDNPSDPFHRTYFCTVVHYTSGRQDKISLLQFTEEIDPFAAV